MSTTRDLLASAQELQELLLSYSTGGGGDGDRYVQLRTELRSEGRVKSLIPAPVEQCRDLGQFWAFIKNQFGHYAERREYLCGEFRQLMRMSLGGHARAW